MQICEHQPSSYCLFHRKIRLAAASSIASSSVYLFRRKWSTQFPSSTWTGKDISYKGHVLNFMLLRSRHMWTNGSSLSYVIFGRNLCFTNRNGVFYTNRVSGTSSLVRHPELRCFDGEIDFMICWRNMKSVDCIKEELQREQLSPAIRFLKAGFPWVLGLAERSSVVNENAAGGGEPTTIDEDEVSIIHTFISFLNSYFLLHFLICADS